MGLINRTVENEESDRRKKGIPSQVFFNHFFAIDCHIRSSVNRFELKNIPFYNSLQLKNANFNLDTVRKLLWNSWSTEYAYNLGSEINSDDYYKFSLHWNFPQAYYSVYLCMTAFHETQNVANDQHEKSIKIFGNSIKDDHYPAALSFYSHGLHEEFKYSGLEHVKDYPSNANGLPRISSLEDAQIQIALFLKSTREKNAWHKRQRLQQSKDKSFFNAKGEFRKNFNKGLWNKIYEKIPVTTILNLLYRLRIKANYEDIETFIHADIDFKTFHQCLGNIIYYMNYVHESYIVKVIGETDYKTILLNFPEDLSKDTARKRYNSFVR